MYNVKDQKDLFLRILLDNLDEVWQFNDLEEMVQALCCEYLYLKKDGNYSFYTNQNR